MIRCETVFNKENVLKAAKSKLNKKVVIAVFAVSVLLIVIGFVMEEDFAWITGIILVMYTVILMVSEYLTRKSRMKRDKFISDTTVCKYTVSDGIFTMNVEKNGENIQQTRIKLSDFYKIVERKEFICVYLSSRSYFIMDKNGFKEGTVYELTDMFRAALPAKKVKIKN